MKRNSQSQCKFLQWIIAVAHYCNVRFTSVQKSMIIQSEKGDRNDLGRDLDRIMLCRPRERDWSRRGMTIWIVSDWDKELIYCENSWWHTKIHAFFVGRWAIPQPNRPIDNLPFLISWWLTRNHPLPTNQKGWSPTQGKGAKKSYLRVRSSSEKKVSDTSRENGEVSKRTYLVKINDWDFVPIRPVLTLESETEEIKS